MLKATCRWESGSTCCLRAVNSIEERTPKTVVESHYQQIPESNNRAVSAPSLRIPDALPSGRRGILVGMTSSPNPDDAAGADPLGAEPEVRELAEVPAVEVISRAAVMLMSSAAEKLGLSEPDPAESPYLDLDEARRVITALAGLVTASVEYLGPHAGPIRDGLQALQRAFREASAHPDEPGKGPGEKYTGPVH